MEIRVPGGPHHVTAWLFRGLLVSLLPAIMLCRHNVVFIVSDDMRPDINAYYQADDSPSPTHPPMSTPHLDALASRALLFKRAYVQYSLGSPSRNSFWTSRRPDSLRCHDEYCYWRRDVGDLVSLPQYFMQEGYLSFGFGKLFQEGEAASGNSDPPSWSKPVYWPPTDYGFYRNQFYSPTMLVHAGTEEKQTLPDRLTVDHATEAIRNLAPRARSGEQPFFIAVGLLKPTHPFQYPEAFNQHYNVDDIPLPVNKYVANDLPTCAWHDVYMRDTYETFQLLNLDKGYNVSFPDFLIREMRSGYYKSLSFADSMVGRVLEELRAQDLDSNTIVVFVGDHGYHLGEQAMWTDQSNFEVALRAPMIIRAPGLTDQGTSTSSLVEFVDLFPTIVDLAGLPLVHFCTNGTHADVLCTEGASMLPLFYDPTTSFKTRAFSQFKRSPKLMGYTIRTPTHRYTEWVSFVDNKPHWDDLVGVELYDHVTDPHETWNRGNQDSFAQTREELSKLLRQGWKVPTMEAYDKTQIFREQLQAKGKEEEEAKAKVEEEAKARAEAEAEAEAEARKKADEETRAKEEEEMKWRAWAEALKKHNQNALESDNGADNNIEKEGGLKQANVETTTEDIYDPMHPNSSGKSVAHSLADHFDHPFFIILWIALAVLIFKWTRRLRRFRFKLRY